MSNLYIFPFLRNDTATSEIYTLSLHDALPISPILSSLAPVKDHVTAITNLELQNAYPGSHATSNSALDRKSTRLNSSHTVISYAVFCLKKKTTFRYPCVQCDIPAILAGLS